MVQARILKMRKEVPASRAMLVGISGIDASGKGFVANQMTEALSCNLRVATINVDGWLNLPRVRFGDREPGRHFYEHALRLEEMFERLVIPLINDRKIAVTVDFLEETADEFEQFEYSFNNVDVVLVEGIFIFKTLMRDHFDLRIWIDCSFEKAMERAIERSQEGLSPEATRDAYERIYFPAQRLHFELDDPHAHADILIMNG